MLKNITKWLSSLNWRYLSGWIALVVLALFILVWRLSRLTGGHLSTNEVSTIAASNSLHSLLSDPLFLPYKFLEWIVVSLGGHQTFLVRLPSVFFGLISLWLFFYITRQWFNKPTVLISSALFATSLWLLHLGRLAVPTILLTTAPLAVVASVVWIKRLKKSSNQFFMGLILAVTIALTFYVPGIWLFWITLAVWQREKLILLLKRLPKKALTIGLVILAALLVPLAFGFAVNPQLVKLWLGYVHTSGSIVGILSLFGDWPRYLLGQGPNLPADFWLGRQPLLAIFPAAAALFGAYFYVINWRLKQSELLALTLACALVLFVLSSGALLGLASGLMFLLVTAGVGYALKLWKTTFPRNPLAYSAAVALIGLVAVFTIFYTTRSYYVAWRYHPATKTAFKIDV